MKSILSITALSLATILALTACATTLAEIEEHETRLHEQLEPWRYNAVAPDGTILCLANDKSCHDWLGQTYLGRGHVGDIGQRRD